jgi:hypothetical protein
MLTETFIAKHMNTDYALSTAAKYLDEYADVLRDCIGCVPDEVERDEAKIGLIEKTIAHLMKLHGWRASGPQDQPAQAAAIVVDMIGAWDRPASLWHVRGRIRIAGAGYEPKGDEALVGVYLPGVTVEMLTEDIAAAIGAPV